MERITVWVVGQPEDPSLRALSRLPERIQIVIGDSVGAFEGAPPADVLFFCAGSPSLYQAVWERAPKARWVHSRSAGVEGLLFPSLRQSAVPLTNARGVFSATLAEFVLGAALFFAKDFRRMIESQTQGMWAPFDVQEISGQTVGIVGYGDIGRAVARLTGATGMSVIALRRRPQLSRNDALVDEMLPPEKKRELFSRSDYVVAAAPLTPETKGMIGEAEIAAMKPTGVLINIGRGPVVDEKALIRALESERIRGAALDVFEIEPLPPGHALFRLSNVLLSPHCADHTEGWLDRAVELFVANLERFMKRQPLLNIVDKEQGY